MHAWWVLGWLHGWFNSQLVNLIGVRATVTQLAGWLVGWWGAWLVGGWVNELEGWVDVPGHRGAADFCSIFCCFYPRPIELWVVVAK